MGAKVKSISTSADVPIGFSLYCPGCKNYHVIYTEPWEKAKGVAGPVWEFDRNLESPTFHPSLLVYEGKRADGTIAHPRCHTFVKAGRIQFLSDCGHELAGQTVEMVDYDAAP